jgi:threonine aldolase
MQFHSDNCGPAHPRVMAALVQSNEGYAPSYGADPVMDEVRAQIRTLFEAPEAAVYLVATGTAANVLGLSTLTRPYQTIFCTPHAHIEVDECNSPEFYTGGAKLTLVGDTDKMTPEALEAAIGKWPEGDVHAAQRGPVCLTQVTERGQVYTVDEITALSDVAHDHGLRVFLDGARFANAIAALGCSPAEMTWKAGVDALSFGGTKNGCLDVEAVIFFDPAHAWEFELRRKRGAHLHSKHRYLSAQMKGYLAEDLWLELARKSNAACAYLAARLREFPDCHFTHPPQANMIFATLPRATHQRLIAAGAGYGLFEGPLDGGDGAEPLLCRLVCDWSMTHAQIDEFIASARLPAAVS